MVEIERPGNFTVDVDKTKKEIYKLTPVYKKDPIRTRIGPYDIVFEYVP